MVFRMADKKYFSINEFAQFARVTRQTLLFYDKIGLLYPASRGENNYRLYSSGQLAIVNVIRTLQELGMTLAEIKELKDRRTPEHFCEALNNQIDMINAKIDNWIRARKLLHVFSETIKSVSDIDESELCIRQMPQTPIILGGLNDYSGSRTDYDALTTFYNNIESILPGIDLNYPAWGMISRERLLKRDWQWPDRYYFYNPEGFDKRPAGLYAIGYARGGYGDNDDLLARLLAYIDTRGYAITGPAYIEYPLNEICVREDNNYLIRVMITVQKI